MSTVKPVDGDYDLPGLGLHDAHAAAEHRHGSGAFRMCQLLVQGRLATNPTATAFLDTLLA